MTLTNAISNHLINIECFILEMAKVWVESNSTENESERERKTNLICLIEMAVLMSFEELVFILLSSCDFWYDWNHRNHQDIVFNTRRDRLRQRRWWSSKNCNKKCRHEFDVLESAVVWSTFRLFRFTFSFFFSRHSFCVCTYIHIHSDINSTLTAMRQPMCWFSR